VVQIQNRWDFQICPSNDRGIFSRAKQRQYIEAGRWGLVLSRSTEHLRVKAWVADQLDRVIEEFETPIRTRSMFVHFTPMEIEDVINLNSKLVLGASRPLPSIGACANHDSTRTGLEGSLASTPERGR